MDFLTSITRLQKQVDWLLSNGSPEDFHAFNDALKRMRESWLYDYPELTDEMKERIIELAPIAVEEKQAKHSWWSLVNVFGMSASEQFTLDDLKDAIRPVRGQLASIEFLYRSTN